MAHSSSSTPHLDPNRNSTCSSNSTGVQPLSRENAVLKRVDVEGCPSLTTPPPRLVEVLYDTKIAQGTLPKSGRVKYTCISSSSSYVIIGASTGAVYCFSREEGVSNNLRFLEVLPNKEGEIVSICLSSNTKFAALGTSDGSLLVWDLNLDSVKKKANRIIAIPQLHKGESCVIRHICWSDDDKQIFVGDSFGRVSSTNTVITNILQLQINKLQANKYIFECPDKSGIVQLDFSQNTLLISTNSACFTVETSGSSYRAIKLGSKARKGEFGACFGCVPNGESKSLIYSARPGSRVWEASLEDSSKVINTLNFRDVFPKKSSPVLASERAFCTEITVPVKVRFRYIHSGTDGFIMALFDDKLAILDPGSTYTVTEWHSDIKDIMSFSFRDRELSILHTNNDVSIYSLLSYGRCIRALNQTTFCNQALDLAICLAREKGVEYFCEIVDEIEFQVLKQKADMNELVEEYHRPIFQEIERFYSKAEEARIAGERARIEEESRRAIEDQTIVVEVSRASSESSSYSVAEKKLSTEKGTRELSNNIYDQDKDLPVVQMEAEEEDSSPSNLEAVKTMPMPSTLTEDHSLLQTSRESLFADIVPAIGDADVVVTKVKKKKKKKEKKKKAVERKYFNEDSLDAVAVSPKKSKKKKKEKKNKEKIKGSVKESEAPMLELQSSDASKVSMQANSNLSNLETEPLIHDLPEKKRSSFNKLSPTNPLSTVKVPEIFIPSSIVKDSTPEVPTIELDKVPTIELDNVESQSRFKKRFSERAESMKEKIKFGARKAMDKTKKAIANLNSVANERKYSSDSAPGEEFANSKIASLNSKKEDEMCEKFIYQFTLLTKTIKKKLLQSSTVGPEAKLQLEKDFLPWFNKWHLIHTNDKYRAIFKKSQKGLSETQIILTAALSLELFPHGGDEHDSTPAVEVFLRSQYEFLDKSRSCLVCCKRKDLASICVLAELYEAVGESKEFCSRFEKRLSAGDVRGAIDIFSKLPKIPYAYVIVKLKEMARVDPKTSSQIMCTFYPWVQPWCLENALIGENKKFYLDYLVNLVLRGPKSAGQLRLNEDFIYDLALQCLSENPPEDEIIFAQGTKSEALPMPLPGAHNVLWCRGEFLQCIFSDTDRYQFKVCTMLDLCRSRGYWKGYLLLSSLGNIFTPADHISVITALRDSSLIKGLCSTMGQYEDLVYYSLSLINKNCENSKEDFIFAKAVMKEVVSSIGPKNAVDVLSTVLGSHPSLRVCTEIFDVILAADPPGLALSNKGSTADILKLVDGYMWSHKSAAISPQLKRVILDEIDGTLDADLFKHDKRTGERDLAFNYGNPLPRFIEDSACHWGVNIKLKKGRCMICSAGLDNLLPGESLKAFACAHTYHSGCVSEEQCPLCFETRLKSVGLCPVAK
eukprot:UC4_evm3s329